MYVRLAFAVAAHLEPEILIVDEVLAVGDAEFQKKSLGKMKNVAENDGRTVFFVSHNMAAIQALCDRAVLLKSGKVVFAGAVDSSIRNYVSEPNVKDTWLRPSSSTSVGFGFEEITSELIGQQPNCVLRLICSFVGGADPRSAMIAFDIGDAFGVPLMQALPAIDPIISLETCRNKYQFDIRLPSLIPGEYLISAWTGPTHTETFDFFRDCISFEIHASPAPNRTFPHTRDHGFLVPDCSYRIFIDV
jgi:lipopolysaccharide transport system ATP-binding protein